ncbi:hypothetical protein ABG067_002915 [Albugo candida]
MEEEIHTIEGDMFSEFSKQLGIPSIRVYEENTLKQYQQKPEIKRKLTEHIAKIEAQIASVKSQKYDDSLQQMNEKIINEEETLEKLTHEATELENSLRDVKDEKNEQGKALHVLEGGLREEKKRNNEAISERRSTSIQQPREIIRRSDLDQVSLPVIRKEDGSERDRDGPTSYSLQSANVNARKAMLIDDTEAYNKANAKFEEHISESQSEIERMQPSMRALDTYEEILARISKEEAELERVNQQCNEANTRFETIKSVRYDRFMEAFNHVSRVIDETYKQLTKKLQAFAGWYCVFEVG